MSAFCHYEKYKIYAKNAKTRRHKLTYTACIQKQYQKRERRYILKLKSMRNTKYKNQEVTKSRNKCLSLRIFSSLFLNKLVAPSNDLLFNSITSKQADTRATLKLHLFLVFVQHNAKISTCTFCEFLLQYMYFFFIYLFAIKYTSIKNVSHISIYWHIPSNPCTSKPQFSISLINCIPKPQYIFGSIETLASYMLSYLFHHKSHYNKHKNNIFSLLSRISSNFLFQQTNMPLSNSNPFNSKPIQP